MRLFTVTMLAVTIGGCTPQPLYQSVRRHEKDKPTNVAAASDTMRVLPKLFPPAPMPWNSEAENAMRIEIKTWVGTPYQLGMIEKGKGADCSGFVGAVFQKVPGLALPRQAADMYQSGEPVKRDDLKFGDLVFFQNTYRGARGASHVGIYIGNGQIAHASTTAGVTYSELSETYYEKHYLGCRRVIK